MEQIGSVYEGIMGFRVERVMARSMGLRSKAQGAKKTITTVVNLEALLACKGAERAKLLKTRQPVNWRARLRLPSRRRKPKRNYWRRWKNGLTRACLPSRFRLDPWCCNRTAERRRSAVTIRLVS